MERQRWSILNRNCKGDERGEYTYTGARGESVMDYVIEDEEAREGVKKMEVEDKIDSEQEGMSTRRRSGEN